VYFRRSSTLKAFEAPLILVNLELISLCKPLGKKFYFQFWEIVIELPNTKFTRVQRYQCDKAMNKNP